MQQLLLLLLLLLAAPALPAPVRTRSPPRQHFWRNDSANLALTAAWNRYYAATPFSWDVTSPNISDAPPVALKWSVGTDSPLGQKDGHGCLFANRYFVIAGGVAGHVWPGPDGAGAAEHVGTGDGSDVPATAVRVLLLATTMYARVPLLT